MEKQPSAIKYRVTGDAAQPRQPVLSRQRRRFLLKDQKFVVGVRMGRWVAVELTAVMRF